MVFIAHLCKVPTRKKSKEKVGLAIDFIRPNFLYGQTNTPNDYLHTQACCVYSALNTTIKVNFENPCIYRGNRVCGVKSLTNPFQMMCRVKYLKGLIWVFEYITDIQTMQISGQKATIEVIDRRVIITVSGPVMNEIFLIIGKYRVSQQNMLFMFLRN